jgi:hypothetical protein
VQQRHLHGLKRKWADVSSHAEGLVCEAKNILSWANNPRQGAGSSLTASDRALLERSHKKRLHDLITKQCLSAIKQLMQHQVGPAP